MIKLYRFDSENNEWKFYDYGVPALAEKYCLQGYVCQFG